MSNELMISVRPLRNSWNRSFGIGPSALEESQRTYQFHEFVCIRDRIGYYRFHIIHSDRYVVSFGTRESCKGFYNSESSTYRPCFLFNAIICRNTEGRGRGSTLKIEGASVCGDYGLLYDESGESTKTLGNFIK